MFRIWSAVKATILYQENTDKVNNIINIYIPFSFTSSRTQVLCMVAHCHDALGHLNGTEP